MPVTSPKMIRLAMPSDASWIHAIYAPVVRDTAISFEWEVPTVTEMEERIARVMSFRPWLVWDEGGEIGGYVYASVFRERLAYQWATEVSVYVRADAQRRGIGKTLYLTLFEVLRLQGFAKAIAGATLPNEATERLHLSLGFEEFGRLPAAGYKFGQWHDVVFWQLPLCELPPAPKPLRSIHEIAGTREFNDAIEKHAGQRA